MLFFFFFLNTTLLYIHNSIVSINYLKIFKVKKKKEKLKHTVKKKGLINSPVETVFIIMYALLRNLPGSYIYIYILDDEKFHF